MRIPLKRMLHKFTFRATYAFLKEKSYIRSTSENDLQTLFGPFFTIQTK